MKIAIIIFLSFFVGYGAANAQPALHKVKALYIIKFDNTSIKTNHLLIHINDIETLLLPSKTDATKTLGEFPEDLAVIVFLKAKATPLNLSMLLTKFNIQASDNIRPVYIDNKLVTNPNNILTTGDVVKSIAVNQDKIFISTTVNVQ